MKGQITMEQNEIKPLCDRCKMYEAKIETDRGLWLCEICDSERLSCLNNPNNPMSEDDFYKEIYEEGI